MSKILNLTMHKATPDQAAAGVVEMPEPDRSEVLRLLEFGELPDSNEIERRADLLADLAAKHCQAGDRVMIGGASYLMSRLEWAINNRWMCNGWRSAVYGPGLDTRRAYVYAFTKRGSEDQPQPDGTVRKVSVFKHAGFVEG